MEQYTYLIVGGGMTADAAIKGIRERDSLGRIGMIGQEEHPPYDRPPLTKGLWQGKSLESIWRKTENAQLHLGRSVKSIDPTAHTLIDNQETIYRYQKLLLATGGIPNRLPIPETGVIYYRTLNDYSLLRKLCDQGKDFIIIGAGFIGTELAAALTINGKHVTLIFKESSINQKTLPQKFSLFLNSYFTEKGVRLIPKQTVTTIEQKNGKFYLQTSGGESFVADAVIAGLGITPNTQLARAIGIETDNGIIVDPYLQTSQTDIWAAGDVANFYSPDLEKRIRIEHEDAANSMGKAAGRNMAGAREKYLYLPFFYSDLFELGYEAIGELSADMDIVEDWTDLYRQGKIYYLKKGKLRGAMLCNVWNQIPKIRQLISSHQDFTIDVVS